MNKIHWWVGVILLGSFSLSSCYFDFDDDDGGPFNCMEGQGGIVTDELNLPEFYGVKLDIDADVWISQGADWLVEVEGQQNVIDEIETDVKNDIWEIEFDDCVRDYDPLKIYITMPELDYIKVASSGQVSSGEEWNVPEMQVEISGSGDIATGFSGEKLEGQISGSGDMDLSGDAQFFDFKISGSGDLNAYGLETQNADVVVSGSGDMRIRVLEDLKVKISGSGDVYYKGYPLIDANITGSGDLIDAN
jgi:hypothetical protein